MANSLSPKADFFQRAVQLLCGNLDIDPALRNFFPFLQEYVPVTKLLLARTSFSDKKHTLLEPKDMITDFVAVCSAGTVQILSKHTQYTYAQSKAPDSKTARRLNDPSGLLAVESDPAAMYLCTIASKGQLLLKPPLFFQRIFHHKRVMGSVTYECAPNKLLTEAHMNYLRILRVPFMVVLNNYFQYKELLNLKNMIWQENRRLRQQIAGLGTIDVIGANGGLRQVMERVQQVANADVPVLISGETGTGKELIAKAVHELSARKSKAFVAVNCGAIPPTLIDSELFGHCKGAFTGAIADHKGRFERANGGTIFLDEIGELPPDVQARLLRVLQERTIEKVGGNNPLPIDFRLIAATNRDLRQMVEHGTFREDLYFRLHVVPIRVPPLRRRKQDIPLLLDHIITSSSLRLGILPPVPEQGEMARLLAYDWPGNVRELQNVVEEALVLMTNDKLRFWPEGEHPENHSPTENLPSFDDLLRTYFHQLLSSTNGRIAGPGGAAEKAQLNPHTLRSKLDKLGVPYGRR